MTRLEWYNQQPEEVQVAFKKYCNTLNHKVKYFEPWISSMRSIGLGGAFEFAKTKEGHLYWSNLSHELEKTQSYEDLQS